MNSRWISFADSFLDICRSHLTNMLQVRRDRGAEGRMEKWARDGVENGRVVPGRNYRIYRNHSQNRQKSSSNRQKSFLTISSPLGLTL